MFNRDGESHMTLPQLLAILAACIATGLVMFIIVEALVNRKRP